VSRSGREQTTISNAMSSAAKGQRERRSKRERDCSQVAVTGSFAQGLLLPEGGPLCMHKFFSLPALTYYFVLLMLCNYSSYFAQRAGLIAWQVLTGVCSHRLGEKGKDMRTFHKACSRSKAVVQVLQHVTRSLLQMHQAGWAHLDLKPGNILRRPQKHSWTLIDFGCSRRFGMLSTYIQWLQHERICWTATCMQLSSKWVHVDGHVAQVLHVIGSLL
jgi:serine/threonine protein kinase